MSVLADVIQYLSQNAPVTTALAGLLAFVFQSVLNHYTDVSKFVGRLLGLVAFPGVLTVLASLSGLLPVEYYPVVALVGQLLHGVANELYRRIEAKVAAPVVGTVNPDGTAY